MILKQRDPLAIISGQVEKYSNAEMILRKKVKKLSENERKEMINILVSKGLLDMCIKGGAIEDDCIFDNVSNTTIASSMGLSWHEILKSIDIK